MDELTRKALTEQIENIIADYDERELSNTDWEDLNRDSLSCILECLRCAEVVQLRESQVDTLTQYIINNMHWCPFKDEANINFEKECVGFGEKGCKECILRNIKQLNV